MGKDKLVRRTGYTMGALEVRSAEGEPSRTIEGYAIMFGVPSVPLWQDEDSEAREVIDASAISRELLDGSDIKMTMFHDNQLILARSNKGQGTLGYDIDERGVKFWFDAPHTADGDKALELVRRGDISGCSFAFMTRYLDDDCVSKTRVKVNGRDVTTYTVRNIEGIFDFTLTPDPAYQQTSVEARNLSEALKEEAAVKEAALKEKRARVREQVKEMRKEVRG